jgi:predicted ribosome quality control (RQC) complex YloA/Tae2 family protein
MTGGGREPLRGRIGSSASVSSENLSPEEMQRMERKVESMGQKLSSFREKQHALEETVTTLTRNIKAWKIAYNNCGIEIDVSRNDIVFRIKILLNTNVGAV